ncbi:MAG: VCBS repeat-containing protein [Pirellulaceae bacterium]|nr:VCBS repeat-containing protein [Pirellulaceae bacterium]
MFLRLMSSILLIANSGIANAESSWRSEVLPIELGVGYAVLSIDISGDGRLDIAIVDSKRIVWLENPTWKTHVIYSTPDAANDNVCFAPHDVDGDGHVDFAVGHDWQFGNSDSGGKIGWLHSPSDPRQPWTYYPLAEEPTTHRMRWIDWDHDGRQELVVVPLKGKGTKPPTFAESGIRLLAFSPSNNKATEPWPMKVIDDSLHVMHNLDVVDMNGDAEQELLAASFEGVTHLEHAGDHAKKTLLGSGQAGTAPAIGASEIRLGTFGNKEPYIATIEPWHGDKVVVYTQPVNREAALWTRHVLDEQLKWGHAVACTNIDDDDDQELIIGVRDNLGEEHRSGVRIFDPKDPKNGKWERKLIEPGQVAVEDLAAGDFDGDGDQDIVAVGRATHNAVIYWNDR